MSVAARTCSHPHHHEAHPPNALPPDDGSLAWFLLRAAATWPHRVAVDAGLPTQTGTADPDQGTLTHGQLLSSATSMARSLFRRGVAPGDRVLIDAQTPTECIVAMQAALLVGAVYVPLPWGAPPDRVRRIREDCDAAVVLGTATPNPPWPCVAIVTRPEAGEHGEDFTPVRRAPDDLAYILYTSGSRGDAKGVCITHRNARAFVEWAVAEFDVRPKDRLSNHASFSFDLSVFDVYAAIAAGACVVPIPFADRHSPAALARHLLSRDITIWYSVPTALTLMLRHGDLAAHAAPASLRTVLFAGEPFPIGPLGDLLRWAGPGVDFVNLYGPTETNVVTSHQVRTEDLRRGRPLPIGTPASGASLTVAPLQGHPGHAPDTSQGSEPAGAVAGQLVVTGPTVSPGYWGRPPHSGPYATGDIVLHRTDGVYEYRGRLDDMLKVRGNRIEPGDIEAVVCAIPGVAGACAVGVASDEGAVLAVAYEQQPGQRMTPFGVRRRLSEKLPPYMVPDDVLRIDALPRTDRGKVDRDAVRALLLDSSRVGAQS